MPTSTSEAARHVSEVHASLMSLEDAAGEGNLQLLRMRLFKHRELLNQACDMLSDHIPDLPSFA